jgi:hypothetical protein
MEHLPDHDPVGFTTVIVADGTLGHKKYAPRPNCPGNL